MVALNSPRSGKAGYSADCKGPNRRVRFECLSARQGGFRARILTDDLLKLPGEDAVELAPGICG